MSLRTVLLALLVSLGAITTGLVGLSGALSITRSLRDEAQQRVDKDLATIRTNLNERLRLLAQRIETVAVGLHVDDPDLPEKLARYRRTLDVQVLNLRAPDGAAIAGAAVPISAPRNLAADPVFERAARGQLAWGTILLSVDQLHAEGGDALVANVRVSAVEPGTAAITDALMWWAACPLLDADGAVVAVLYGGRALNRDFALVDDLREIAFGRDLYAGKPRGTVTIFLNDRRVATNVLGPDGRRAVNTPVSDEVRRHVLENGEPWHGRARVVDAWYLSAYEPIHDPAGRRIGMLYVGLLEAPYADTRASLIFNLLLRVGLISTFAIAVTFAIVNRISAPLRALSGAAVQIAAGDRAQRVELPRTYAEISQLARSFRQMQEAIAERDQHLNEQNRELAETNEKLEKANRNYMNSLAFVTHELKSPLAAMQSMIHVVRGGYVGEVSDKAQDFLARIQRNCEELQDMVKNYLDLARAERDELTPKPVTASISEAILQPCAVSAQPLLDAREMRLEVECPPDLVATLDPELTRIAIGNLLSNAAKYGRDGGAVRLSACALQDRLSLCVWNAGDGFAPEESAALFDKFTRLHNATTRRRHGSGLGLYLVRAIAEVHGGAVRAESEPGQWASFCIDLPLTPAENV